MLKYIVLIALTIGALMASACGSSAPEPAQTAQSTPAPEAGTEVRIGNEIGNRLPNFELTLTNNGEKLTSTSLVESGRPAFLFFFATT
ncbi:MAG: hypothetical protein OXC95_04875 [Dehalococcoidia bacterium]|nr:hypothetical protein [Dehalococcoidia bacterium]